MVQRMVMVWSWSRYGRNGVAIMRTSSASSSANKKPEYVKSEEKKEDKKVDEKKRDMSKVKCYNCNKEGHFAKDCKKVKVKDYNYYKTKMLLAKKDSDEQVLLAEDQAWIESSNSEESTSSAEETLAEIVQIGFGIIGTGVQRAYDRVNRALLTNIVEKFLGTGLEVCLTNVDLVLSMNEDCRLLTDDAFVEVCNIALNEITSNSTVLVLLAKASSSQSWCES
ncbi:integrase, catalytic region, zinc finger, CCHC-type containing protein [Tanacetum coccineum]